MSISMDGLSDIYEENAGGDNIHYSEGLGLYPYHPLHPPNPHKHQGGDNDEHAKLDI